MANATELPCLPFTGGTLFKLAPGLRTLQESGPIAKVRVPAGDEVWLVTRYEEVKALFADPRLGRLRTTPGRGAQISNSVLSDGTSADDETEDADHARLRSRLLPCFSSRRMRALTSHVESLVDEMLTELSRRSAPSDLHAVLSRPLPIRVISELLGVPFADQERLHEWTAGVANRRDREHSAESMRAMGEYMHDLVRRKRTDPGQDIISELIVAENGTLTTDEIAELAAVVLFAGNETTVTRIDLGVLLLLANPYQLARLRAPNPPVAAAVEEVLRLAASTVGGGGGLSWPRYARTDIEVGDVTVRRGDTVLLSLAAANRDGRAFAEPDRFDVTRPVANPQLMFGHGSRYCIGATLARIELAAVFRQLFLRFPRLELAVPIDELRWHKHVLTGGLAELPVRW